MLPGVVRRVTIRRYLLGGLSVRERERLEERYFRNDELFEEIEKVEDELVDAYVRGHLPQSESRLFEENYLTSERRRHRVGVARELLEYAANAELAGKITPVGIRMGRFRFRQLVFFAGFLLAVAIVGWRFIAAPHHRDSKSRLASSESHLPQAQPPAISLLLRSSARGRGITGSGSNLLIIPPGEHRIQLEVYPQDLLSTRFRVELFRGGRSVWRQDLRPAAGQELILELHSSDVPTGTYFLSVIGLGDGAKSLTEQRFGLEVAHREQAPK